MAISGDVFRINQVYELLQEGQWPLEFYAAAPEPESNSLNYGWFGGGGPSISTVDRINFASDTGTASARGPLSLGRFLLSSTSNLNYGWFGGGFGNPGLSLVDRITFSSDTDTASTRGTLSLGRAGTAAVGNDNYGWFGGGDGYLSIDPKFSTVDRITFATDTGTASARGPLSLARGSLAATGNDNYGWFGGGISVSPGTVHYSTVNRITFSSDTVTAPARGLLSLGRTRLSATGNDNYGWFGGGATSFFFSTVDRINFASDTGTASVRGPLTTVKYTLSATGNDNYGWFGGGNAPSTSSFVDRIDYADDTATASVRGPLSLARSNLAAT